MAEGDPGVPGALGRALRALAGRVPAGEMDRVWVFPPLRNGRRETGVLAAGCGTGGPRRILVTLSYRSEETGRGVAFESGFQEEGEAPPDRLPRIMKGVVRRMDEAAGEPDEHEIAGDPARFEALVVELGGEPEPADADPEPFPHATPAAGPDA